MAQALPSDSEYLYKTECPNCPSSDAFAIYSDGHGHCFSCGHHTSPNSAGDDAAPAEPKVERGLLPGEFKDLTKRGIREETARKFGYMVGRLDGTPVQIAPYRDKEGGTIVAQHIRFPDKDFIWTGKHKRVGQLWGQHLWPAGGKRVVVTEGEIDCMTVSQLQDNKWPVVSLPNGAHNAAKDIAKSASWLESFDEIVLLFDMDEAGREAALTAANVLMPGKVKIAELAFKDANEAHLAGKGGDVIRAIWNARPYRPDGIREVDDLIEAACRKAEWGIPWPWQALTQATYGIRPGEIYAFGGGVGCGKTEVFKEIIEHLTIGQGLPVGVLFLEEPPAHTLKVLAGKIANKRFHVPGVEYDEAELRAAVQQLRGKVYFYDHFGAKDWDTFKAQMRFLVQGLGIKHLFLDHLTALVAGVEDERRALDKIMEEMASLALAWGCTIYFISHLTTPKGTPHEEGGRVHEKDFTGSRAIARWSHFMFGIERNKQEPELPCCFRVLKDRYTGDGHGRTFGLMWDRDSGRLMECDLPEEGEDATPRYDPRELDDNPDF